MEYSKHSFCALPFVHQEKFFNHRHNICCYGQQSQSDTDDQNSLDSFNSNKIKQIRTQMLEGQRPSECTFCWNIEDSGGSSPRTRETSPWLNLDSYRDAMERNIHDSVDGKTITPVSYDLRYSNTCTLKCRMCNSGSSSAINAEYKKINTWPRKFWTEPNPRINHEIELTYDIQKIYLAGGEPLVEPYNLEMLIKLADVNPDVALIINTSLNHLSDKFLTVLNKFNNLTFAISLDGVGQLNDYIRNGSEFATVIDNIERIRHHQIMFSTCVSIYNVFDVPDIIRFVLTHYPEAEKNHWINNVNDLEELYVENTPPELRSDIIKELRAVLPVTRENSTTGVENLIIALEQDNFNPKRFENFKKYTTILDQSRGEDIRLMQPKLAKYFKKVL